MVSLSEDFVGGFFGFGRTYGASLRFECDRAEAREAEWAKALAETAKWRAQRQEKATSLHLFFEAPAATAWEIIAFIKEHVIVEPERFAAELRGLYLRIYVVTPEMEHLLYAELFPEATRKPDQAGMAEETPS